MAVTTSKYNPFQIVTCLYLKTPHAFETCQFNLLWFRPQDCLRLYQAVSHAGNEGRGAVFTVAFKSKRLWDRDAYCWESSEGAVFKAKSFPTPKKPVETSGSTDCFMLTRPIKRSVWRCTLCGNNCNNSGVAWHCRRRALNIISKHDKQNLLPFPSRVAS